MATLAPLNGGYFHIASLEDYARKVATLGQSREVVDENGELSAYVLYYDNGPKIFVTMVWTHPDRRRQGLASRLLADLIAGTFKPISLQVHQANPAALVYRSLRFHEVARDGDMITMTLEKGA